MCVKELNFFVTVKLLEDTPAVLSLGKLCEDNGYSHEWTSGQKPQLIKDGKRIKMQHGELRTDPCPWFIDRLFKLKHTYISNIFAARSRKSYHSIPHQQEVRVRVVSKEYGETRRVDQ